MVKSWIEAAIIFIVVLSIIGGFNGIQRMRLKVREGASGIEVALEKRYNLLIQMAKIAREYTGYEKQLHMDLVKVRKNQTLNENKKLEEELGDAANELFAVAEGYPELKSSNNYLKLQEAIVESEDHLQAARRLYNANVSEYNGMLVAFPSNLIAIIIGARKAEYYHTDADRYIDLPL